MVDHQFAEDKVTTENMKRIYAELRCDIDLAFPGWADDGSDPTTLAQNQRRTLIRAIFAFVEGTSYSLRQKILSRYGKSLAPAIVLALDEKQININGLGEVGTKSIKVSLIDLLKLTIKQFVVAVPPVGQLECKGADFEKLVGSVKIRDRLMHPRSVADLYISDQEIISAVKGMNWYMQAMTSMLLGLIAVLEVEVADLRKRKEQEIALAEASKRLVHDKS